MISLTLSTAAELTGGRLVGDDQTFAGVCTDSRQLTPTCLFAALKGDRADGHDFAGQAIDGGACAVLCQRPLENIAAQIIVEDVLHALGVLARGWRKQLNPVVVAITGSNGKTTVKEIVATILADSTPILASQGNFNNELGLPLTLFRLTAEHRYAVLELGASKAGDIRYLADICLPDVGLVNNAGPAHLQGFGSLEGVAQAKGELLAALPETGNAVFNGDQQWADLWASLSSAGNVARFGENPGHAVNGRRLADDMIEINTPADSFKLRFPLPGQHNLMNALAATAVATALEVPLAQIRSGLESVSPVTGRLNRIVSPRGWTVIDDSYNANPASLYAGLQVLAEQSSEPWLVLGDMLELGGGSRKLHSEVGEAAAGLGVKRLYCVGELSRAAAETFGKDARHFPAKESLIGALLTDIHPGITCLIKGSRSMGMESVVAALLHSIPDREAV